MNDSDRPVDQPMNSFSCGIRGFAMGAADVVPGVSGGTVALITGIYPRLITAISHFDRDLVSLIRQGNWGKAAKHIDLRFLLALGVGIAVGFLATMLTIAQLLKNPESRPFVLASFFGMIVASSWVVYQIFRETRAAHRFWFWLLLMAGIFLALGVTYLSPAANFASQPPAWYLFACGAIAICAMILPGISGALILLLLGVYAYLTEIPHHLLDGERVVENLGTIAIFGLGCLCGLLSFSKLLRYLLQEYAGPTYTLLLGLMIGSLSLLWPFQTDTTPQIEDWKSKIYRPAFPDWTDWRTGLILMVAALFAAAVLFTFQYSRNSNQPLSNVSDLH